MAEKSTKTKIRVVFVGKGGSGKSTIAGTFAQLLARSGAKVVALDYDPMPGLSYALGLDIDDMPIPEDSVIEGPLGGPKWILKPGTDPEEFLMQYSIPTDDGVRYFQFGNVQGPWISIIKPQHAWSEVVSKLPQLDWNIVGDVSGGLRQAMNGWTKYADVALIVVEPTVKGVITAKQLLKMTKASWGPRIMRIVANKVQSDDDLEMLEKKLGVPVIGSVPWSLSILEAERARVSPLVHDPQGTYVEAVSNLITRVLKLYDIPIDQTY